MTKELAEIIIDGKYTGWNQDMFKSRWMKLGGCGAVTACDICIYLALRFNLKHLYPFDCKTVTSEDYIAFSEKMRPFLYPRISGIDKLELFEEGFEGYLKSVGDTSVGMKCISSEQGYEPLRDAVRSSLDEDMPVPMLVLKHKSPNIEPFVWHWFYLAGYEEFADKFIVKLVTYGTFYLLDLYELWDSGYARKGGIVRLSLIPR